MTVALEEGANDAYMAAVSQLQDILESPAKPGEKKAAKESLRILTMLHGRLSMDKFEGRTAILHGLIVELQGVIQKIKPDSPIQSAADELNKIVKTVTTLLQEEKKNIV